MIANKQGPSSYVESSRTHNDPLTKDVRNRTNEGVFKYYIDESLNESNSRCFQKGVPFIRDTDRSIPSNLVDTETALKGINRKGMKYGILLNNEPDCPDCRKCGTEEAKNCSCLHCHITRQQGNLMECQDTSLVAISTRDDTNFTRADIYNKDRFDFIYENLTDSKKIPSNNIIGVNSRLQLKDQSKPY